MNKIILVALLLFQSQTINVLRNKVAASITLPVYSQTLENDSCTGTATTCAVTFTPGGSADLVIEACGDYADNNDPTGITSLNSSSSVGETFTQGTFTGLFQGGGNFSALLQINMAVLTSGASHTLTCTSAVAMANPFVVVYDYTGGTGSSVNVQSTSNTQSAATFVTPAFTTTNPTITVACTVNTHGFVPSVGTINGTTATHFIRHSGTNWWGCEDLSSATSFTGGTATMPLNGSDTGVIAAMAVQ